MSGTIAAPSPYLNLQTSQPATGAASRLQSSRHHTSSIMASGAFVDPKKLLLAGPLVSSTCTLLFARDQDFFLSLLTPPSLPTSDRAKVNSLLPSHFSRFFNGGIPFVLTFLTATTGLGCASAWSLGRESRAFGWYVCGVGLAVGHLGFTPWVAPRIKAIVEDEGKGSNGKDNVEVLSEWLAVNRVRMWTTDLGAWVCCAMAAITALTVKA
ncbi:hypothetical protein LIA77_02354 [Sarocladium implicatum]|nr:hypothetical protein LIA77_02354 [Sarocladium implicatum]